MAYALTMGGFNLVSPYIFFYNTTIHFIWCTSEVGAKRCNGYLNTVPVVQNLILIVQMILSFSCYLAYEIQRQCLAHWGERLGAADGIAGCRGLWSSGSFPRRSCLASGLGVGLFVTGGNFYGAAG